jgi:hypothetical protein
VGIAFEMAVANSVLVQCVEEPSRDSDGYAQQASLVVCTASAFSSSLGSIWKLGMDQAAPLAYRIAPQMCR